MVGPENHVINRVFLNDPYKYRVKFHFSETTRLFIRGPFIYKGPNFTAMASGNRKNQSQAQGPWSMSLELLRSVGSWNLQGATPPIGDPNGRTGHGIGEF